MRKEVRLGTAIGGIFVAVLIVYAVVIPKSNKPTNKKSPVVLETGKSPASGADAGPATGTDSAGGADVHPSDTGAPQPSEPMRSNVPAIPSPAAPADSNTGVVNGGPAVASPADEAPPTRGAANWAALLSADHVDELSIAPRATDAATSAPVDTTARPSGTSASHAAVEAPAATTSHDNSGASAAPSGAATIHKVQAGETFSSIAKSVYGDPRYYKEIAKANPSVNPARLRPGTSLTLPDKSAFQSGASSVAPSATLASGTQKAARPRPAVDSKSEYRIQANDSLFKISTRLYGNANHIDQIYQLNKQLIGTDPAKLKLDTVLKLPEPPTQTASR